MGISRRSWLILALAVVALWSGLRISAADRNPQAEALEAAKGHLELPDDDYLAVDRTSQQRSPATSFSGGAATSVQVNVDGEGNNIVGDAANEPSIAVDPANPSRMVVGWRQFDTIANNFRQAGWAWSADGGAGWTFPGSIDAGNFRSDPVLGVDANGVFYYYSLGVPGGNFAMDMFLSIDGGMSWSVPFFACGGDKAWFTLDRTGGIGNGHAYAFWTDSFTCPGQNGGFNRSTDGAMTWDPAIFVPNSLRWGTLDVTPDGVLHLLGTTGGGLFTTRSSNAQNAGEGVIFDGVNPVDLGGDLSVSSGPNPGGLLGQAWIAVNQNNSHLYALASVNPPGSDPLDVRFSRSIDGGLTWSPSIRVNDDAGTSAYQWFGTMSVAPNGRIDAIWNDTRNSGTLVSELFYSYSNDGGDTWSPNAPLSPSFDPLLGHPQQNKIGDYYDMVSFDDAAHLAWAATFNGEQDVYYTRIPAPTIFTDGFESGDTSAWSNTIP